MDKVKHAPVFQHSRRVQRWTWVHRWSSLICTGFMLMLCLTGLPLIFGDEIEQWNEPPRVDAHGIHAVSIDELTAKGRSLNPGEVITSILLDKDDDQVFVTMAPSYEAMKSDLRSVHYMRFDLYTGEILEKSEQTQNAAAKIVNILSAFHENMFMGFAGTLLLSVMAMLLLVAVISGIVLYGPFTRKLEFGEVRFERSRRVRWLDLHNLLGITTLLWVSVVGATGIMNEFASPLFDAWKRANLTEALAGYRASEAQTTKVLAPLDNVVAVAARALPRMDVKQIVPLGNGAENPHHYLIWTEGRTALTRQILQPVLVNSQNAKVTAVFSAPWYLSALNTSRPLHFGDYGGMPLKIIWALLDIMAIIVLVSGLYLWSGKRQRKPASANASEVNLIQLEAAE